MKVLDSEYPKFVVVIGASAGGLSALSEFVGQLNPHMDAAFCIVMHLSRTSISNFLLHHLQPRTSLYCQVASENAALRKGNIYIAASNQHLLVKKGKIILGQGPEENRWRPSIDVLFRSAAAAYSTRCVGVVLTGLLDDGTTGMLAIKRSGGTCVVQDPNEAEYPEMPLSVLNNMEVNYCISLANMGEVIAGITEMDPEETPAPEDVIMESQIAERVVVDYEHVKQLGEKSIYACPDCGGGLWNMDEGGKGQQDRYRCHIGHSYSEKDLVIKQYEVFESTLWTALRIMEERRTLYRKMETDHAARGLLSMANDYKEKAAAIQIHVDKMKEVLFASQAAI